MPMIKSILEKLSRRLVTPEPVSKMEVRLENSGALRVDVEGFLSTRQGQKDLKRAQELWQQGPTAAHRG
jgi:hypothetical protein